MPSLTATLKQPPQATPRKGAIMEKMRTVVLKNPQVRAVFERLKDK